MKNTTTLSVLLIAFSVLLLAYVFIPGDRPKESTTSPHGKLVSDFLPDKVTEILAKRGGVTVKLKKVDKDWLLPEQKNRKALGSKVDTLLNGIRDANIVQGRPGSKLSDFDLTPETRTEISLVRESGTTKVLLGKSIAYNSSFAEKAEGEGVLEIDKNPSRDAGVSEKDGKTALDTGWFYDLKVLGDEPKDAIDIVIKKDHTVTRVQKVVPGKGPLTGKVDTIPADAIWWITEPDGVAADDSKVGSLLSTLLNLNASGYADEVAEKDRGFDKPQARVLIRLKDGTERSLTFGAKSGADAVCLSVSGKPDAYKVQPYVMDTALKTSELAKKDEPPPAPETGGTPPPPNAPSFTHPPPHALPPVPRPQGIGNPLPPQHPYPPPVPLPPIKTTPPPSVPAPKVPEVPAPKLPDAPKTVPTTTASTTPATTSATTPAPAPEK